MCVRVHISSVQMCEACNNRLIPHIMQYGWGSTVTHDSVGTIDTVEDNVCGDVLIDFPGRTSKWRGKVWEIELAAEAKMGVGSKVMLSPSYVEHSDAAGGPLKPGELSTV